MHTFLIAAITADGFIAQSPDQVSTSWTSKEDKAFFSKRTKEAGVVVMGSRTFSTIGMPLPGRHTVVYSTRPLNAEGVEVTAKPPRELLADLESRGHKEVAICGGSSIYTLFMGSGAIDTLYLTVHPLLFGKGIPLFSAPLDMRLSLAKSAALAPDILLLEYHTLP